MESTKKNSTDLLESANRLVGALITRFENIIALAPVTDANRSTTAFEVYQMEVETAALVKAAEDVLSLTRSLKEMWLFGPLDTIGDSKAEAETDKHAKAVAEKLRRLIEREREVEWRW